MADRENITATLLQFAGQKNVITVYRAFVDFTGDLYAGMMLSQLLYWTARTKDADGWIAKSDKEFEDELCLTRYSVRGARKRLQDMEIIDTKLKRFNGSPTIHYKVHVDTLYKQWTVWIQTIENALSNSPLLESTQTLTEISTESTTENPPADADEPKKKSQYILNMERLEKFFADERGLPVPDWNLRNQAGLNKTWRTPLNGLLKLNKGDIEATEALIRKTIEKMRDDKLTVNQPLAIVKTAESLYADGVVGRRRRRPSMTQKRLEREKAEMEGAQG